MIFLKKSAIINIAGGKEEKYLCASPAFIIRKEVVMWWIVWLVICVGCMIIEASSPQLTSIWFAAGAFCALIVSFIAPGLWWLQLIVFVTVSAAALALTRPLAKKLTSQKKERMNADRFIGEEAVVIQRIDNVSGEGQVKSKGVIWSARAEDDDMIIDEGEPVIIKRIEGVKVIVNKERNE